MSKAERESYNYIEMTCPVVDELTFDCKYIIRKDLRSIFDNLKSEVTDEVGDRVLTMVEYRIETLIGKIKDSATEKLRQALINSISDMYIAEDERDKAISDVDSIQVELEATERDLQYYQDLYESTVGQDK